MLGAVRLLPYAAVSDICRRRRAWTSAVRPRWSATTSHAGGRAARRHPADHAVLAGAAAGPGDDQVFVHLIGPRLAGTGGAG